jgi:hypothetical protein
MAQSCRSCFGMETSAQIALLVTPSDEATGDGIVGLEADVLVDGVGDIQFLQTLRREVKKPIMFNQIAGGKSKPRGLGELREAGVGLVIYSTPCLFAAHSAIQTTLSDLKAQDGKLPEPTPLGVDLREVNQHLRANLATRHGHGLDAKPNNERPPALPRLNGSEQAKAVS